MKRFCIVLFFIFASFANFAQSGTRFLDNRPWKEVLQRAKRENKMIFVDCYTSWCGPCKKLANEIFPQEKVGKYLNERFINAKYDVEKGEGLTVGEKYAKEIKVFPTMLILTSKGEVIHKVSGARPADELIAAIEAGLQGKTIYTLEKEFEKGNRDWEFIQDYLDLLGNASEREQYKKVARAYAAQFPLDSLLSPRIWAIMEKWVIEHPYSPEFRFVVEHLDELETRGNLNRYRLEEQLSTEMGFAVNAVFLACHTQQKDDSLATWEERIDYLKGLLKHPVKGFPASLAELSLSECKLKGDVDLLFDRFCVLTECGFTDRDIFLADMLKYLVRHLNEPERLQRCAELARQLKTNLSATGWMQTSFDEIIDMVNGK